jgi:hypothetical protein
LRMKRRCCSRTPFIRGSVVTKLKEKVMANIRLRRGPRRRQREAIGKPPKTVFLRRSVRRRPSTSDQRSVTDRCVRAHANYALLLPLWSKGRHGSRASQAQAISQAFVRINGQMLITLFMNIQERERKFQRAQRNAKRTHEQVLCR